MPEVSLQPRTFTDVHLRMGQFSLHKQYTCVKKSTQIVHILRYVPKVRITCCTTITGVVNIIQQGRKTGIETQLTSRIFKKIGKRSLKAQTFLAPSFCTQCCLFTLSVVVLSLCPSPPPPPPSWEELMKNTPPYFMHCCQTPGLILRLRIKKN